MTEIPNPADFLQFNAADARKLFDQLDHIHLIAFLPDAPKARPRGQYFGDNVDAALEAASKWNANGWNVHWTLNYVGPGCGTKPSKNDIQAARGAHLDRDPPPDGSAWDKAGAIQELADLATPPSLIIDSGNGVNSVWLLDAPAKDWLPIESVNGAMRGTLDGDDCHNIDRVLRVPGTINYPNKAKRDRGCVPCMATWVQEDTGQRYAADELVAAFPAKAPPPANDRAPSPRAELIAAILAGDNWHNNVLKLTGRMVRKRLETDEILAMAEGLTLPGYTVEDTIADMRGMIEDARRKGWGDEPADDGPPPAEEGDPGSAPDCDAGEYMTSKATDDGVRLEDFHAYMPMHNYIFGPSGEFWPATSVNSRFPKMPLRDRDGNVVQDDKGKPKLQSANQWLDKNRPVEQATWAPGQAQVITDRLISEGGWIYRDNCNVFNLYRPPACKPGDAKLAAPWIDHIRTVYPENAHHIVHWLAHRVQRPDEKINHAIVLGGAQGIGKDTILEPVKAAIGPWNFQEISPKQMLSDFNGFVKSVILRVSEARDLGDVDRFAFYDHMKTYTAAPPDVLRVNEKHIREHSVFNVCGVIITTNHKTDGIYLPADDRRHYVAWSEINRDTFEPDYWTELYRWFREGGTWHVAEFLRTLPLDGFDPKAPPPKTAAFWDIVSANRAPEDAELADALDTLGNPDAVTIESVKAACSKSHPDFHAFLSDRRNSRKIPHRFEGVGYVMARNPHAKDGNYKVRGKRCVIYAKKELCLRDQLDAAERVTLASR